MLAIMHPYFHIHVEAGFNSQALNLVSFARLVDISDGVLQAVLTGSLTFTFIFKQVANYFADLKK